LYPQHRILPFALQPQHYPRFPRNSFYWNAVLETLRWVENDKAFWGGKMLPLFGDLGPELRTIHWTGRGSRDKRWIAAIADRARVEVVGSNA